MAEQPKIEEPNSITGDKVDSPWHRFVAWLRQRPAVRWIIKTWSPIWRTIRILWLCGYDVVAVLVVLFVFVFNAQGQDLLRISAERSVSVWNLIFWLSTAALALTAWFTSRVLLGRKFSTYHLEWNRAQRFQRWLPRVLGIAVPSCIAIGLLIIASGIHKIEIWILCGLYVLLTAIIALFTISRRRWFGVADGSMLDDQITELEGWYLIIPVSSLILAFILLGAFMIWPVGLAQWLGAPAIVMLAFTSIVWLGAMVLTYLPLSMGQPSATALALVLAVVFGFWIDNHYVRLSDETVSLARLTPAQHYTQNWRTKHPEPILIDGRKPVIIVAAAGGGIRAAYWTATNLAKLENVPGFPNNLFAISGVSGGSLGAATYVALKRTVGPGQPTIFAEKARTVLSQDFLSPVLAGMLFPDLTQRFVPISIHAADRQRFLELAWEKAMGMAVGTAKNPFPGAFTKLYSEDPMGLPSLLLNTTVVDSGRRAIVSNLDVSDFTDTRDLLTADLTTNAIRLSAAAGASARFTYVSPAGSLIWSHTTEVDGELKTVKRKLRVVDGGYFENSGAATATDTFDALQTAVPEKLFPILILIRNNPKAPRICRRDWFDAADGLSSDATSSWSDKLLVEVSSPIRALLHARAARGRLAEVDAARAVEKANNGAVIELPLGAVLRTAVAAAKGDEDEVRRLKKRAIEPPLGWSLSDEVRKEMDDVLAQGGGGLSHEYDMLRGLLEGRDDDYVPCRAR